jgi:hypothetical protein
MPFALHPNKLSTINFPLDIKEQTTFKNQAIEINEGFALKNDNECHKFEMDWGGMIL